MQLAKPPSGISLRSRPFERLQSVVYGLIVVSLGLPTALSVSALQDEEKGKQGAAPSNVEFAETVNTIDDSAGTL